MTYANAVIQGVMLGGFYALLACGLSLLFGVMRIINLAHGSLAVLGAFLAWYAADRTGWSPFIIVWPILVVMFGVGWALQRGLLERSLRAGVLIPLLTTFGLAVVIDNVLLVVFSPDSRSLGGQAGWLTTAGWRLSSHFNVSALGVTILVVAVVVLVGLQIFLARTKLGRDMRATAQDPDTAELVGIDSRGVYAWAAGIAVATAGLAGFFLSIRALVDPSSGPTQLIFAFEAVVIGGFGSLWGTLVGGLILGVAQTVGAQINPQYANLTGHLVFLVLITVRSGGIFGARQWSA
ncbi:MAG: branched-chain amino acid ABC transporter permease [Thermoleophilia bacterium]